MRAVLALVLVATVARADVYSWTDDDGVQHFTNIKPHRRQMEEGPRQRAAEGQQGAAPQRCPRCDKVAATDTSPERFHRYDAFIAEASSSTTFRFR